MAAALPQNPRRSAIIIGAGFAGLGCARELHHLGWDVIVLEARERVGGRVLTESFMNGAAVDVGASFIHGINDNDIAELAVRGGVSLHERLTCPLFEIDGSMLNPETDKLVEDEFNATLEKAARRKFNRDIDKNESLEAALKASQSKKLTPRERRAFNWHLSNLEYSVNSDLDKVKADGWDADDPYGLDGAHCVVDGPAGMGFVASYLSKGLPEDSLYLGAIVKRIIYYANGVKVEYYLAEKDQIDGEDVSSSSTSTTTTTTTTNKSVRTQPPRLARKKAEASHSIMHSVSADVCVVTIPLGVLKAKTIEFCPALPKIKRLAIENLGFGLLNKIALLFPYKFWSDDCEIFGWCSDRRGELPIFVDLSQDGNPILGVLVSGTPAEELEMEHVDDYESIIRRLTDILTKIFKSIPPILEVKVTRWKSDEFAQGSYSFVACQSSPHDYDILAAPVSMARKGTPRLFFAGEATNKLYPASVHGAFLSGIREAQRLGRWFPLPSRITRSQRSASHSVPLTSDDRMYVLKQLKRFDTMTEEIFRENYLPKFTFKIEDAARRGQILLSKSATTAPAALPAATTASTPKTGKKSRGRTPTGGRTSNSSFSVAKKPKISLETISPGDRVQVFWKNGKYYSAWISTVTKNDDNQVIAGVYYDDGSFELVNLSVEKWKPLLVEG